LSQIYTWYYRGKTTLKLYSWAQSALPAVAFDSNGQLLEYFTFNGETVVQATQSGEVRRSTKGNPGPGDPYSPGINPSPWESNV
jgi:hypothetical protein